MSNGFIYGPTSRSRVRGYTEVSIDPWSTIAAIASIFEPKERRQRRQELAAIEALARLPQEFRLPYVQALTYEPGALRRMFRPSEREPKLLFYPEMPIEAKIKALRSGRVEAARKALPPPFYLGAPTEPPVWKPTTKEGAEAWEKFKSGLLPPPGYAPTTKEEALEMEKAKVGLKPPPAYHPKTKEEALEFEKEKRKTPMEIGAEAEAKEKARAKYRKPGEIKTGQLKELRSELAKRYLNTPTVWPESKMPKGLKPEEVYDTLDSHQRAAFDIIIDLASSYYAETKSYRKAIDAALREYGRQYPGAFQGLKWQTEYLGERPTGPSVPIRPGARTPPPAMGVKYGSISDVQAAYKAGKLTYDEAAKILKEQFGVK